MKVPLEDLEKHEELRELIELLPVLRELAEKYRKSRKRTTIIPKSRSSESKFIRSFRKKEE